MAKQISMGRIRSEMRNAGQNEYLGSFPDKRSLCEKYPEKVGHGNKKKDDELLGGKVFNDSSYAIIDDGINSPIQMKYNSKGKWVQMGGSGGGGETNHEMLDNLMGGDTKTGHWHLTKPQLDNSTRFKGAFASIEEFNNQFPVSKLKLGDYAVIVEDGHPYVYNFDTTLKTMIKDSSKLRITDDNAKQGILMKSYVDSPVEWDYHFIKKGSKLYLEKYVGGIWKEYGMWGGSSASYGTLYMEDSQDELAMISYMGEDQFGKSIEFTFLSHGKNSLIFGSRLRSTYLMANGDGEAYVSYGGEYKWTALQKIYTDNLDIREARYKVDVSDILTKVEGIPIQDFLCLFFGTETTKPCRYRMEVRSDGKLFWENMSHDDFIEKNPDGTYKYEAELMEDYETKATTGKLRVRIDGTPSLYGSYSHEIVFQFREGECNLKGDVTTQLPVMYLYGNASVDEKIATREWVDKNTKEISATLIKDKIESLTGDERLDVFALKNTDLLSKGNFRQNFPSDISKTVAEKGDWWKNTTGESLVFGGITFHTNDELYCHKNCPTPTTIFDEFYAHIPFTESRVQSDWDITDGNNPAFIKNKPVGLVTEADSDDKTYGRKNKAWVPLTDIQEPLDTFQYLRTLGKWVKHEDKFNICAFGDKRNYLKDEFASYNGKLYRALKNTFRSPDYTSVAKVDTGVPLTEPYNTATGTEYPQMQIFVPFVSNSNQSITGFRLNIETSSLIENSYVCLMERVVSSSGSVARVLTVEKFTANNGNLEYKLTTPLTVIKDKNYELFVLLPSAIPFKIMGSYMSVLENAIFKVGLVEGTPYSTAFDQRKLGDARIPSVGSEYQNHQGTWTSGGIMCLTPIIESTTVKDWIEVVGGKGTGGEVNWKDIIDKPDDIITDTILAETNRMHLTMDSHGGGLMASTDIPELPKIGLTRYDIPSKRVIAGNKYSDTVIQAGKRILSRVTSVGDTLFSNVSTSQVLSKPEFIVPFTPTATTIIPTEFSIAVNKESTFTLMVGDIEVLSSYKLSAGKNNITLPLIEIPCKIGQKIDVVIQAGDIDNPCFMGEIIGEGETKEEKLFYSFSYETYKDGTVMTSDTPNRKLLLTKDGKIQVPNSYGDTMDVVSIDGDMAFIGNTQGRMAILSKEKPFMGYLEESFSLLSIDTEDQLPAKNYSVTFKLKKKDVEYGVDSITLSITKPSMVRASVNGVEYGDYRQLMPIGEITLKPVGSRMAMISGEFTVNIVSAIAGVFIGNVSATPQVPKLTVNLSKPMISRIASETYAHKVNVDKMNETDNLRENYRVTGNVQQIGIPIISKDIQYTVPSRCKEPRVDYRNHNDICFDGDYKMVTNEKLHEEFTVKFPPFKTGYSKIRVEAYLDVYKQPGFAPDMIAETEDAPKVFMAISGSGNDLREVHHSVYCSKSNMEYHSFFDYYEGDQISFVFGENVDFSNCYMVMDIHTISDDPNGTSNMYDIDILDTMGKIKASAVQEGVFIERAEFNNTLRRIDTIGGDNIYLNKSSVSTIFYPLEPQRLNTISYEVAPESRVILPKLGDKNEYIATNLEACNIVGEDYLKIIISGFGGVQIENQDVIKMVARIYKLNQTTPIKYNLDSILLMTTEGYKLDYECVNNEYKDYYEIEYRINGAPTEFVMKVGDGNDWTNLSVVLFFAGLITNKDEVSMFTRDIKINPELYDGWDSKVNLVNGENITVMTPNEEVWKHIDFNTIKVQTECMESQPEFRNDVAGMYIYYPANTVLQTAGQTIQYTIPVPKEFENNWVDIELCFDETKGGVPHINPDDFYAVGSGDSEKTVRQEYMTTILTIKDVPASADGTPVIIRGVAHPSSNSGTNISDCETRFITFRTNKNKPKETLMFVDNKINKELLPTGEKDCVYLNDKMRIKAIGFAFVFEANYDGSKWVEVGRMS